ncbi:GNAT family N-acetyltransferase [Neobacillus dielmonensis]|uniref:GNAT family N-acetyltransferase n=1 Tax=Neobacillus dielmonensis TaxID=1347369 RepID=UPI0005A81608|nr:GNAT family N-acetyltransferase [Neobacillus dielmonensis]
MLNEAIKASALMKKAKQSVYPTFVYSVLDQYIPGKIYLTKSETSAIMGTGSGIYAVIGDVRDQDGERLLAGLFQSRQAAKKRFTLFSPSQEWDLKIDELLENDLTQYKRHSFIFNPNNYRRLVKVDHSQSFSVHKYDSELISKSHEFNQAYIKEYWGSTTNFLKNGFGFCLLEDGQIACECLTIFTSSKFAEIDIVTQEPYRGRGLALTAAQLFIDYCLKKNIAPIWNCDVNNLPSIKLAEKLGFEHPSTYSIFVKRQEDMGDMQ